MVSGRSRRLLTIVKLNFPLRMIVLASVVATLCYLAAKLGGALILQTPQTIWPLWPGCAVLVAVLLLLPRRSWVVLIPAGLAGFVLYDLQVGVSIHSIAWLILADGLEILIAAFGVSYSLNGLPRLNNLKALAKYSFFTVFLSSLVVSSLGIHGLNGDRWVSWRISFLSEALAFLTVTPAILGLVGDGRTWLRASRAYYMEATVLIASVLFLSFVIFVSPGSIDSPALLYSLVPFLIWSALRFRSGGVGTSVTIVALMSIWGAVHGRGPFIGADPITGVLWLQMFLLITSVPFMVLAVLVEDRERAEGELRNGEQSLRLAMEDRLRLAAIVESSDDAIISKALDGIIVSWNASAQRMFGFSEAEAVGQPIAIVIPDELRDEQKDILQRVTRGECIQHLETVRVTKDGKKISVSLTISPVRNSEGVIVGASKIIRDITDRKHAEQILRESEERFRLVANTAPVLLWMSGPDKLCTFFNQCWLDFTGRPLEQELGNGWASGVHPEDLEHCLAIYSGAFEARAEFDMEYRLRRSDGKYRWIVDHGVPRFESDGTFCGYIGSCMDITDRKRTEDSLEELSGRLITAQEEERVRIARELHDDFSQRLALLGIGLGRLWKKRPESEEEERILVQKLWSQTKEITSDVHRLSHQLHSSKLEYVGLGPALRGLCEEISDKYRIQVEFTQRGVLSDIPKDIALCLFRICQESLSNVVKHSQAKQAQAELFSENNEVCLRITDSGLGFDLALRDANVGIGLIGMRERLRLVGGRLSVQSAPMRGTEILAEVPLPESQGNAPIGS